MLVIQVVQGDGPNLMGRDWLSQLGVNLGSIQTIQAADTCGLEVILEKHAEVFSEELGCFKGPKVKLQVQPNAVIRLNCTFYIERKGGDRLEHEGIISPVRYSWWATPIVPVLKKNNTVRICGDFKVTVNQPEAYPLPRIDEIFSKLSKGKFFSKVFRYVSSLFAATS